MSLSPILSIYISKKDVKCSLNFTKQEFYDINQFCVCYCELCYNGNTSSSCTCSLICKDFNSNSITKKYLVDGIIYNLLIDGIGLQLVVLDGSKWEEEMKKYGKIDYINGKPLMLAPNMFDNFMKFYDNYIDGEFCGILDPFIRFYKNANLFKNVISLDEIIEYNIL